MTDPDPIPATGDRLAKIIARSGLCSRRDAEGWIKDGRVVVNGKIIRTPAFNVTERDEIKVDGAPLAARQGTRVWLYHKPAGLVVTEKDPEGRDTIFEALEQHGLPRVVTIGRLDINTEGLLLLTNDGGLKRVLELPATGWLRKYRVRAHGKVTQAQLDGLKNGVEIEGIKYGPIEALLEREQGSNVWLQVALREGKNREVKNVLGALGLQVNRLIRISYGPFQLGELPIGAIETVKARILRDQLGKRLAEEAGVDFDSELPERAPVKARPVRDRDTGRGTNTVEIASQRFRFTDRAEKTIEEVRAERPRQDRPGRSGGRAAPLKPRREEAQNDAPARQIHFEDGRAPEEFVAKTYGKKPKFEKGGDRPPRAGFEKGGDRPRREDGDRPGFGDRPKRAFSDRPARDGADRPKRDFAGPRREFSDRPARPAGSGPKREFSDRPKRDYGDRPARPAGAGPKRDFADRPKRDFSERPPREGADRPKRDFSDRPKREFGDRPPRQDGDRPAFAGKPKFAGKPRGDFSGPPRAGADARADGDRPRSARPAGKGYAGKPGGPRPFGDKPGGKSFGDKSFGDKPGGGRSFAGKPGGKSFAGKPGGARPAGAGRPGGPTGGAPRPAGPGGKPRSPRPPRTRS